VDHLGDAVERLDLGSIHSTIVADQADGGALRPGHRARLVPHLLDHLDDARDMGRGGIVTHDDQHQCSSISNVDPSSASVIGPA
jgi:hypothetical protein